MIRAAISIMANIAEGFERGKLTEFHQFLSIAKASCAELRSHLYVALDAGYLSIEQFELIKLKAEEVGKVLEGFASPLSENVMSRNELSTQHSALSTL